MADLDKLDRKLAMIARIWNIYTQHCNFYVMLRLPGLLMRHMRHIFFTMPSIKISQSNPMGCRTDLMLPRILLSSADCSLPVSVL
jgi:hypothetical protein